MILRARAGLALILVVGVCALLAPVDESVTLDMDAVEQAGLERTASSAASRPRLIEWTGERCVPWAPDPQVIYEHMHRYNFVAPHCAGKRVLDLASGEGYGSAILGAVASEVVGIDIDGASVAHARLTYGTSHIRFVEGSMLDLELVRGHSFDVVVCFEALEHVEEHELLMEVILEALRSGGVLVISTPDRTVYTELHEQHNPFHVHELDRQEFRDLLGRHFQHAAVFTQEVATGSLMQALDGGDGGEVIRLSAADDWSLQSIGTPPYLIAFASDDALPSLPSVSTLIDVDVLLARRPPALAPLEREVGDRRAEVIYLTEQVTMQDAQIERLEGSIRALADEVQAAKAAHAAEVGFLKASRGWRALETARRPYRAARRLARPLRRLPPFRTNPR